MTDNYNADDLSFELDSIKVHDTESIDSPIQASPYKAPVEIIMDAEAWESINQHAREDTRVESGGILLGEIYEYDGNLAVRITRFIPARDAVNSVSSIQFTFNTWQQMENELKDSEAPEKLIGWYHTHPGMTAFFSEADHFMHNGFFTQPWHIALVIDPINDEFIFYRRDKGVLTETREFLLQTRTDTAHASPINLRSALVQGVKGFTAQMQKATGDTTHLYQTMLDLLSALRQGSSDFQFEDLLQFIVAAGGIDAKAREQARSLLLRQQSVMPTLDMDRIDRIGFNDAPSAPIDIQMGWVAQLITPQQLLLRSAQGLYGARVATQMMIPKPMLDLTIDRASTAIMLSNQPEQPLLQLVPSLEKLVYDHRLERASKAGLTAIMVSWERGGGFNQPKKILVGKRELYVLDKQHLHVLRREFAASHKQYHAYIAHTPAVIERDQFDFTGWAVDVQGNLYILTAQSGRVWRYDAVLNEWRVLIQDPRWASPRALTVGWSDVTVLDDEKPTQKLYRYDAQTGEALSMRTVNAAQPDQRIRRLFSDGMRGLYLVTAQSIYLAQ